MPGWLRMDGWQMLMGTCFVDSKKLALQTPLIGRVKGLIHRLPRCQALLCVR